MNVVLLLICQLECIDVLGMIVFVCGVNGFIGWVLCVQFEVGGYCVLCGVCYVVGFYDVVIDFVWDVDL